MRINPSTSSGVVKVMLISPSTTKSPLISISNAGIAFSTTRVKMTESP